MGSSPRLDGLGGRDGTPQFRVMQLWRDQRTSSGSRTSGGHSSSLPRGEPPARKDREDGPRHLRGHRRSRRSRQRRRGSSRRPSPLDPGARGPRSAQRWAWRPAEATSGSPRSCSFPRLASVWTGLPRRLLRTTSRHPSVGLDEARFPRPMRGPHTIEPRSRISSGAEALTPTTRLARWTKSSSARGAERESA
jgi:hypothetical protein